MSRLPDLHAARALALAAGALMGAFAGGAANGATPAAPPLAAGSGAAPLLAGSAVPGVASGVLVVRAAGTPAGGAWPRMEVRVAGAVLGAVDVTSTAPTDYRFKLATEPAPGSVVDVVFTNDAAIGGEDRNLFVAYVAAGAQTVLPTAPGAVIDKGVGAKAFDGLDVVPGQGGIYWNGALRLKWPARVPTASSAQQAAARLLLQATFGPTRAEIDRAAAMTPRAWLDAQMAQPYRADFVNHVQAKYALGDAYRPRGANYTDAWVGERFWATAATAPDQLRKRVAFALHHIFMVSQADSSLYHHARAYARYLDVLNEHAFGNFRTLLEEIALSPAMGIYLSHMRNRREDPATGRMLDENFARELMQLFSIGLIELQPDGSPRRDALGSTIDTYGNADVMAMARVFTGWSWALPDNQLTDAKFRWGNPDYSAAGDTLIDLKKMRAYPGQHSMAEVRLFEGKPHALTIPAQTAPELALKLALDALYLHPNVGPFIGRQLIQQLVTSNPSPAYVARVSAAFANNGAGVRGDMAAVVRAVLLDAEARAASSTTSATSTSAAGSKLREPVLRVAQWLRAFDVRSPSGEYRLAWELDALGQRATRAPSVFGWFRPGYVPPGTWFMAAGATAPEFQLVNESTTASWVNTAEAMAGWGLGWNGSGADAVATFAEQTALAQAGQLEALVQNLNLLLFAGRMSEALQQDVRDAVASVGGSDAASHANRARAAVYVALSSPEFLVQR